MSGSLGDQLRKPSGFFGKMVARMMKLRNRKMYEILIKQLDIKTGDRLYEIGYGHGMGIHAIAAQYDCTIAGIDFSELMYREATRLNRSFIEKGRVKLSFGDILVEENGNAKYDKVYCANVIYFWTDLDKAFSKVFSMVERGGMFFIYMDSSDDLAKLKFTGNFCKYTIEEVENALTRAGFSNVEYFNNKGYYVNAGV
jgi:cyclopropane fatty-acyl-phospholipid synthase-like methyltransferase